MPATTQEREEDYELLLPSTNPTNPQTDESKMGNDEHYLKREGRTGDLLAQQAALVSVMLFMTVSWTTVLINNPGSAGWFAFHPILQSLSIGLFSYGIITLQPTSQPKTKAAGLVRHQTAMVAVGFPAIFLGTSAIFYNKILGGKDHFTTTHGKLGLISMIWLTFQVLLGGGSVWFGGAAFGGGIRAKAVWRYHRISGYFLFPLLLLTAHFGGGRSYWGESNLPWFLRSIAYTVAPIAILASIFSRIRLSKMKIF